MSLEIEATDVIKVILQFCKESGLTESFKAIQNECHVSLNTVESVESFVSDINNGRWDVVLPLTAHLKLPRAKMENLYELVVLEMIELREVDTARAILKQTEVFQTMKKDDSERYARLERLCNQTHFDAQEAYEGMSKEKRRGQIAHALSQEVTVVPPSRLMDLIGQALKWQQSQGLIPMASAFDLFRGAVQGRKDEIETFPTTLQTEIHVPKECHHECGKFTSDGQMFITGSADGMIEVWDFLTGKIRNDLQYQQEENFMFHESAVLCLDLTKDSELLVSGTNHGEIKIWRLRSGQCLRRFVSAHAAGITSICFSKDGSHVLSASFDHLVKIHGLKSGKLLKEFRGHQSFVNMAIYSADGSQILSCSSDCTIRLWDAKRGDCSHVIRPTHTQSAEPALLSLHINPKNPEQYITTPRSSTMLVISSYGEVLKTLQAGKQDNRDFIATAVSPSGDWYYAIGEDNQLYCFSAQTHKMEHVMKVHETGSIIGLCHHPHRNIVATFNSEGETRIWKAA